MIPKFRAWLLEEREMQNVLAFDTRGHSFFGIEGTHITVEGWCDFFEVDKQAVLMQSTGQKDKNGRGIFDGDFLTDGEERWIVKYFETECGFSAMGIGKTGYWSLYHLANGHKKGRLIEVIGNKYENPELLKFR